MVDTGAIMWYCYKVSESSIISDKRLLHVASVSDLSEWGFVHPMSDISSSELSIQAPADLQPGGGFLSYQDYDGDCQGQHEHKADSVSHDFLLALTLS